MFANEEQFIKDVAKLDIDDAPRDKHREALKRRMLDAFERSSTTAQHPVSKDRGVWKGRSTMKNILKKTAPVPIAACIIGLILVITLTNGGTSIALADVQGVVEKAQTVCFTLSFQNPDGSPHSSLQVMYMYPGLTRQETETMVTVIDWENGKLLGLDPETKTAHKANVSDMDQHFGRNWLSELKSIIGSDAAEKLGSEEVDGRKVEGWRIIEGDETVTVWADAKSAELVRVEFESEQGGAIMSDFEFDRQLDKSLFSTTPPTGYSRTESNFSASDPNIKDVAALLDIWARGNNDIFPDALTDHRDFQQAAPKAFRRMKVKNENKAAEVKRLNDMISRAFYFLYGNPGWKYAGKGVKLGDSETPVFWYRPPEKSAYLVIYGDLNIGETTETD